MSNDDLILGKEAQLMLRCAFNEGEVASAMRLVNACTEGKVAAICDKRSVFKFYCAGERTPSGKIFTGETTVLQHQTMQASPGAPLQVTVDDWRGLSEWMAEITTDIAKDWAWRAGEQLRLLAAGKLTQAEITNYIPPYVAPAPIDMVMWNIKFSRTEPKGDPPYVITITELTGVRFRMSQVRALFSRGSNAAENECESRLLQTIINDPARTLTKKRLWEQEKAHFGDRLSQRSFDRAYAKATSGVPRPSGRPRRQQD